MPACRGFARPAVKSLHYNNHCREDLWNRDHVFSADMTEVPQGREFSGPLCSNIFVIPSGRPLSNLRTKDRKIFSVHQPDGKHLVDKCDHSGPSMPVQATLQYFCFFCNLLMDVPESFRLGLIRRLQNCSDLRIPLLDISLPKLGDDFPESFPIRFRHIFFERRSSEAPERWAADARVPRLCETGGSISPYSSICQPGIASAVTACRGSLDDIVGSVFYSAE
jgi:hypothetical protein